MVIEVVGSWDWKIEQVQGYFPTKPKTMCRACGINLALKWLVGSVMETCRVGEKWLSRWWEAGIRRSSRCRNIPMPNQKPSALHSVLVWYQNGWWGVWWGPMGEGKVVVEKLGAMGGENEQGWACCPKTVNIEHTCSISTWQV